MTEERMNGADALLQTFVANGVTACFANPGTSEMQFVSALDREPAMRSVLCLFEGVATGAADGYGRVAGKPACTLLHLGPGYGNGLANLHNARRAYTPVVNVIGDHATYHRQYDAPLNSDIPAIVGPNSIWVKSADSPDAVGALAAEAVAASFGPPGGPVSLILPADSAWSPASGKGPVADLPIRPVPDANLVYGVAERIRAAKKPLLLISGELTSAKGLALVARIEAAGVRVMTAGFTAKQARGAGRFLPARMAYFAEQALDDLAGTDLMVLAEAKLPVAFFAYPDRASVLVPEGCVVETLCDVGGDGLAAVEMLAEALGAPKDGPASEHKLPDMPSGPVTAGAVGASFARHLPEGAIVSDDGVTSSAGAAGYGARAAPHDWLSLTGGAIGQGMPVAVGAAVAAPDRKVISLNGDGAAMYTVQSLWTMARENLDVTVIVFANHVYRILSIELDRTGAGNAGPAASRLLDLGDPRIDWVSMARGMGVPASRCETAEAFDAAFFAAMQESGPKLIEVVLG